MGLSENHREPQENAIPASPASSSAEGQNSSQSPISSQSPEELKEESRKIRRLQIMVSMVTQVIAQDSSLSVDEASEMVADTRKAALAMFPDKELAFDLIYWPRLQRLMRERYRMQ
jgi:hypothetical protein